MPTHVADYQVGPFLGERNGLYPGAIQTWIKWGKTQKDTVGGIVDLRDSSRIHHIANPLRRVINGDLMESAHGKTYDANTPVRTTKPKLFNATLEFMPNIFLVATRVRALLRSCLQTKQLGEAKAYTFASTHFAER